jgi:hypothetical protein
MALGGRGRSNWASEADGEAITRPPCGLRRWEHEGSRGRVVGGRVEGVGKRGPLRRRAFRVVGVAGPEDGALIWSRGVWVLEVRASWATAGLLCILFSEVVFKKYGREGGGLDYRVRPSTSGMLLGGDDGGSRVSIADVGCGGAGAVEEPEQNPPTSAHRTCMSTTKGSFQALIRLAICFISP